MTLGLKEDKEDCHLVSPTILVHTGQGRNPYSPHRTPCKP
jgi:hypothetical protein